MQLEQDTQNFRLKVEIENHNGMVDEESSYNYTIDNYDDNYNDDYATGWLLDSLFQRTLRDYSNRFK